MASLFFHKARASHGQLPVLAWSTGPELGQLEVLLKEGVYNKSEFNTLRTCTSVAGQITLILRSRSRASPNHPKSHVYLKKIIDEIINNKQGSSTFFFF